VAIGIPSLAISTMAFKLNGINFNPSILDGHCCVISPSSEVIYRAYLGMDVMQVSNAPNFLLNLV
jgi:photosystem II P680 reaction center D1 protein